MTRVIRMLDLSSAHLPEHLGSELAPNNLLTRDGVIADARSHGFLLWVPEDPVEHACNYTPDDIPPEVLAIQLRARALDCDYVLFDSDAEIDPELPTWIW